MEKLPNTIKITRAIAGEPRSYSEEQFGEILKEVGSLPRGKIIYEGAYAAFQILGESIPELAGMWHEYMRNDPLEMTRKLALRLHLEGAAWTYKKDKKSEGATPSQRMARYSKIANACNTLIEELNFLELYGGFYFCGDGVRDEVVLVSLKNEIQRQQELCSKQKVPLTQRHQRDLALHNLIYTLCHAWAYIIGGRVSAGSVSFDGKVGGPLIRFIESAIKPLGIKKTPAAIRKILRVNKAKSNR